MINSRVGRRTFATIKNLKAREILDSRGNPTVEVDILASCGNVFRAAVPSGASTGIYEALELRDKDERYMGKGVQTAVNNINNILAKDMQGVDLTDQRALDDKMIKQIDGTTNEWGYCKSKIGANAILAVSLAAARGGAAARGVPLYQHLAELAGNNIDSYYTPVPSLNIINGGEHAGNKLAMQEFMILPTGASSFKEGIRMGAEVYHHLKNLIKDRYGKAATNVGDEGGFGVPAINDENETLELIMDAIQSSGHAGKIGIGLDVAASEFYVDGKYDLSLKTGTKDRILNQDQMIDLYANMVDKYPIVTIEDPFDQDDFAAYTKMQAMLGDKVQIVGDDLLVTNPKRVQTGIDQKMCNALLLKVNQIGTVTESIDAWRLSRDAGWGIMVSHRSGETEDNFIADLVVGLGTGQIKSGAPCRSDRLAKYNQILRIEEELGSKAKYAGADFRYPK